MRSTGGWRNSGPRWLWSWAPLEAAGGGLPIAPIALGSPWRKWNRKWNGMGWNLRGVIQLDFKYI